MTIFYLLYVAVFIAGWVLGAFCDLVGTSLDLESCS